MRLVSKRSILRQVIAVAMVLLVVTACSSSKKAASTSTTAPNGGGTTASTAAAPTGTPIKIGVICTCTGPLAASNPDIWPVYKGWVDSVNATGGINGHPVQTIFDDDQGNPGTSESDVHTMVGSDHVIAIADMTNDDETWAAYVQAQGVPVVGTNTSTTPMFTNPDFYSEGQTEDSLFSSIIDVAKAAGATNLGLLYCAEAVQCQEGIAPLKAVGKLQGLPVTYTNEVAATAPTYSAQCVAAKQAHITGLFVADVSAVQEKVGTDCSQQDYHPIYVIDGFVLSPGFATSPGLKEDTVFSVTELPYFADTPAIQAMNASIDKYAPGQRTNSGWNEFAMASWVSGLLFQDAARAGGLGANGSTPTSAQLVTGLESLKGDTLGGLTTPLTFSAGKAHPIDCWYTVQLKNGQYSTPQGLTPKCATNG